MFVMLLMMTTGRNERGGGMEKDGVEDGRVHAEHASPVSDQGPPRHGCSAEELKEPAFSTN